MNLRLLRRSRARSTKVLLALFVCLSLGSGCSVAPTSDPFAYRPSAVQGQTGAKSELDARIEFMEKRLEQRPKAFLDQAELAGLYLQKGKLRQRAQEIEKAQEWTERSLAEFPNEPAQMVKADLLQMEHHFDESLDILKELIAKKPNFLEARVLATRALLAQGKQQEAEAMLAPIENQPYFAVIFLRGQVAESVGSIDEARAHYEAALGKESEAGSPAESARLRAVWARLEVDSEDLIKADQLLESAKAIPVEVPLVDLERAKLNARRKEWKSAAEIARHGFALYQDPQFLIVLAEIQASQGLSAESKESYRAAAEMIRRDPFGHERDLALALFRLDSKAHRDQILELMQRELGRRQDSTTLKIWAEIKDVLGPLPSPTPF